MQQDKHNTSHNRGNHPQRLEAKHQDTLDLREFWKTLVRHKRMILVMSGATLALALLFTLGSKNVYRATATLQIERESTKVMNFDFLELSGDIRDTRDFYQTQFELIRSRALAAQVIKDLKLDDKLSSTSPLTSVKQWLGIASKPTEPSALENAFLENLSVEPVKTSRLVLVHYDSSNPEQAAQIANAVVATFQKMNTERRINTTNDAKTYLEASVKESKAKLDESVQRLDTYSRDNSIIIVNGKIETTTSLTLNNLAEKLQKVEQQLAEKESINAILSDKTKSMTERVGALQENVAYIQTLLKNLDDLKALNAKAPSANLRKQIRQREDEVEMQINVKRGALPGEIENLKNTKRAILEGEAKAKAEAIQEQEKFIAYGTLRRQVEINQELYQDLFKRLNQVSIAGGIAANNIAIIDDAQVPLKKFKPNLLTNLSFGALLGMLLGISAAFLREFMDDTVKNANELERISQLAILGVVPEVLNNTPSQLAQLTIKEPKSSVAEAFRSLRTAMRFVLRNDNSVVFVTSACAGEGKSTTATNLACAYANAGSRVLLIDADLRNPSLHRTLDVHATTGLADYLQGNIDTSELVQATAFSNLSLIPAGKLPEDPSELLSSPSMKALLATARTEYDHILIDGPPVLGLADALVLASLADTTLIAVRAENTRMAAVTNALKRLRQANASLSGLLLNRVALHRGGSYGYDYSNYYYNDDKQTEAGAAKKGVVTTLRSLKLL